MGQFKSYIKKNYVVILYIYVSHLSSRSFREKDNDYPCPLYCIHLMNRTICCFLAIERIYIHRFCIEKKDTYFILTKQTLKLHNIIIITRMMYHLNMFTYMLL